MLYYANGGPGPATKLYRVDVPSHGRTAPGGWAAANAERWEPKTGWRPYSDAQGEILDTGDFFLIDESQVSEVQQQLRDRRAQFQ